MKEDKYKKDFMNSRERVLAAINHKEPDRVPIDIGATTVTGMHAIAYTKLKEHLGMKGGHTRIHDVGQQLAEIEDEMLDYFRADCLDVGRVFTDSDEEWYDVEVNGIQAQFPRTFKPRFNPDGSVDVCRHDGKVVARMSAAALVIDQVYYPMEDDYPDNSQLLLSLLMKNAISMIPPPFNHLGERGFWRNLKRRAIELKNNSERALMLNGGISLFQFMTILKRMDKVLLDLIRYTNKVDKFLDIIMEFQLASLSMTCKYLGDTVDIIMFGDDYGENKGPFFSPRIFKKLFKPRLEAACDYVKKHSNMKIFFHSCGAIAPIIPDLIEVGIDILNPVQINAKGMDPKFLKEEFGDDITFWGGGADTRHVLNFKSPIEVKEHVTNLLEIFAPGGGYVWNTVHNILPDVPPENIVAAIEAVHEFNDRN